MAREARGRWLTVPQAAARLGVSAAAVYRMIRQGRVAGDRTGEKRGYRLPAAEVERLLAERRPPEAEPPEPPPWPGPPPAAPRRGVAAALRQVARALDALADALEAGGAERDAPSPGGSR